MNERDTERGRLLDALAELNRKARGSNKAATLRAMRRIAEQLAALCVAEAEKLEGATKG